MISAQRKAELEAADFYVEDMGAAYGPGWWAGQFRWMRIVTVLELVGALAHAACHTVRCIKSGRTIERCSDYFFEV